jgi:hypothetical protein
MTQIRPAVREDYDQVAELFLHAFPTRGALPAATITRWLVEMYVDHPWQGTGVESLVVEDAGGRIAGYIGALPMPARMQRRDVRLAVGGNYMVSPGAKDAFAAMKLLKAFVRGPQDIAMTDTANLAAANLWKGVGGQIAHFPTLQVVFPIRPAGFAAALAGRGDGFVGKLRPLLRQAARPMDALAGMGRKRDASEATAKSADLKTVFDFTESFDDPAILRPKLPFEEYAWLIGMAQKKTQFGPLRIVAVDTAEGKCAGVGMYYPNPRGLGQILHWQAMPNMTGAFLRALVADAAEQGAVALIGMASAQQALEFRERTVAYLYRNNIVTLAAPDKDLTTPLRTGDVALTRLTGEWWSKLQGDAAD